MTKDTKHSISRNALSLLTCRGQEEAFASLDSISQLEWSLSVADGSPFYLEMDICTARYWINICVWLLEPSPLTGWLAGGMTHGELSIPEIIHVFPTCVYPFESIKTKTCKLHRLKKHRKYGNSPKIFIRRQHLSINAITLLKLNVGMLQFRFAANNSNIFINFNHVPTNRADWGTDDLQSIRIRKRGK